MTLVPVRAVGKLFREALGPMSKYPQKQKALGGGQAMATRIQIIQGYSFEDREDLLPALVDAIVRCGGWVLNRRDISEQTLELQLEMELRGVFDLYAALLSAGVEMTRSGHRTLAALCSRARYVPRRVQGEIVPLRVEVSFLHEITPHWELMARPARA